jgi:hypothetical protein
MASKSKKSLSIPDYSEPGTVDMVVEEAKDLSWGIWSALKGVLSSKTTWVAVGTFFAAVACEKYNCDKTQIVATLAGLGKIVQQGLADFGKNKY